MRHARNSPRMYENLNVRRHFPPLTFTLGATISAKRQFGGINGSTHRGRTVGDIDPTIHRHPLDKKRSWLRFIRDPIWPH